MKSEFNFEKAVLNEVPRRTLSPQATERFEDTYKMLGLQKEPAKSHKKSRRAWVASVASLAACFTLLFGVNFAFPAFAESIPVIGRVFQSINDNFKTYNDLSKHTMGTNVGTFALQTITAETASFESNGYRLSVEQAFSDGNAVTFSMKLQAKDGDEDKYENIGYPGVSATINGQDAEFTTSAGLYPQNGSTFGGTVVLKLPEQAENGTPLDIALSIPSLEGKDITTKDDKISIDAAFDVSFPVTVDTSNNRSFAIESEEDNGAKVLGVEATPLDLKIKVLKPYWGFEEGTASSGFPEAYLEDGTKLSFNSQGSDDLGYDPWSDKEQTAFLQFDGAPAETEKVVLRFYKNYEYQNVLAEFTVNLADGTAIPSKTYQEGGALDIDSAFNYGIILWQDLGTPQLTNDFAITDVFYSKSRPQVEVGLKTPGDYKELKVEAYNREGTLIGSTVSQYGTKYENENWYWDEDSQFWPGYSEGRGGNEAMHAYRLYITPDNGYEPAWKETITFKVTDNQTGEEILSKDITLDGREFS